MEEKKLNVIMSKKEFQNFKKVIEGHASFEEYALKYIKTNTNQELAADDIISLALIYAIRYDFVKEVESILRLPYKNNIFTTIDKSGCNTITLLFSMTSPSKEMIEVIDNYLGTIKRELEKVDLTKESFVKLHQAVKRPIFEEWFAVGDNLAYVVDNFLQYLYTQESIEQFKSSVVSEFDIHKYEKIGHNEYFKQPQEKESKENQRSSGDELSSGLSSDDDEETKKKANTEIISAQSITKPSTDPLTEQNKSKDLGKLKEISSLIEKFSSITLVAEELATTLKKIGSLARTLSYNDGREGKKEYIRNKYGSIDRSNNAKRRELGLEIIHLAALEKIDMQILEKLPQNFEKELKNIKAKIDLIIEAEQENPTKTSEEVLVRFNDYGATANFTNFVGYYYSQQIIDCLIQIVGDKNLSNLDFTKKEDRYYFGRVLSLAGELSKELIDFINPGRESGLFTLFKDIRNEKMAHSSSVMVSDINQQQVIYFQLIKQLFTENFKKKLDSIKILISGGINENKKNKISPKLLGKLEDDIKTELNKLVEIVFGDSTDKLSDSFTLSNIKEEPLSELFLEVEEFITDRQKSIGLIDIIIKYIEGKSSHSVKAKQQKIIELIAGYNKRVDSNAQLIITCDQENLPDLATLEAIKNKLNDYNFIVMPKKTNNTRTDEKAKQNDLKEIVTHLLNNIITQRKEINKVGEAKELAKLSKKIEGAISRYNNLLVQQEDEQLKSELQIHYEEKNLPDLKLLEDIKTKLANSDLKTIIPAEDTQKAPKQIITKTEKIEPGKTKEEEQAQIRSKLDIISKELAYISKVIQDPNIDESKKAYIVEFSYSKAGQVFRIIEKEEREILDEFTHQEFNQSMKCTEATRNKLMHEQSAKSKMPEFSNTLFRHTLPMLPEINAIRELLSIPLLKEKINLSNIEDMDIFFAAGEAYIELKKYDQAIEFFNIMLTICETKKRAGYGSSVQTEQDQILVGIFNANLGLAKTYDRLGHNAEDNDQKEQAYKFYEDRIKKLELLMHLKKELELFVGSEEEVQDKFASLYNSLANTYEQVKKYDEAIKYQKQAIQILEELGIEDDQRMAIYLLNLGVIHQEKYLSEKEDYTKQNKDIPMKEMSKKAELVISCLWEAKYLFEKAGMSNTNDKYINVILRILKALFIFDDDLLYLRAQELHNNLEKYLAEFPTRETDNMIAGYQQTKAWLDTYAGKDRKEATLKFKNQRDLVDAEFELWRVMHLQVFYVELNLPHKLADRLDICKKKLKSFDTEEVSNYAKFSMEIDVPLNQALIDYKAKRYKKALNQYLTVLSKLETEECYKAYIPEVMGNLLENIGDTCSALKKAEEAFIHFKPSLEVHLKYEPNDRVSFILEKILELNREIYSNNSEYFFNNQKIAEETAEYENTHIYQVAFRGDKSAVTELIQSIDDFNIATVGAAYGDQVLANSSAEVTMIEKQTTESVSQSELENSVDEEGNQNVQEEKRELVPYLINVMLEDIKNFDELQKTLEMIELHQNVLKSIPHGSHNLYEICLLTALCSILTLSITEPEAEIKKFREGMRSYDFLFLEPSQNANEDEHYNNLRYSFETYRNYHIIGGICEEIGNGKINLPAIREAIVNMHNLIGKLRYIDSSLSQTLLLDSIMKILALSIVACTKMIENKQVDNTLREIARVLITINKNLPAIQLLVAQNFPTTSSQETSSDGSESVSQEIVTNYNNMQPGQENDPIQVLGRILFNLYIQLNSLPNFQAESFRKYLAIVMDKMKDNGIEHYQADELYQSLLSIYYNSKMLEVLQGEGLFSEEHTTKIIPLLIEYKAQGGEKSPNTLPIFILEYYLTGKKEAIKDVDRVIYQLTNQVHKTIQVSFLVEALLKYNELQRIVNFFDHKLFTSLKADDSLFVSYLYIKTCLNSEILKDAHINREPLGNVQLQPEITLAERERVVSIDSAKTTKLYQLVHVLIALGEQQASITSLENMIAGVENFTLQENRYVLTFVDFFRDVFIYGPSDSTNKEAINFVEKAYKMLLKSCIEGDKEAREIVNDRLLKLYLICDMHAEASELMHELALVDGRYKGYLNHLAENPQFSDEEKNEELVKFSQVLVEYDVAFVNAPIIYRHNNTLIQQAIALTLQNEDEREAREAAVEIVQPMLKLGKNNKISLVDCRYFTDDRGVGHYVYCEPNVLNEIRDQTIKQQFETQLTNLGFTRKHGSNGIKHLNGDVYEVKIDSDPRILGFGTNTVIEADKSDERNGAEVHLLYFAHYVHSAHGQGKAFDEKVRKIQKEADKCNDKGRQL